MRRYTYLFDSMFYCSQRNWYSEGIRFKSFMAPCRLRDRTSPLFHEYLRLPNGEYIVNPRIHMVNMMNSENCIVLDSTGAFRRFEESENMFDTRLRLL